MTGARRIVFAGAGLVGAATAATSSVSLYELAQLCSIGATWSPLSAALPIALDAGAGVGALAWITERGPVRAWGRGIAVGALLGSLAGNALQHAITAGLLAVTLPVVLAVGATIPAMLWATMHLAALMRAPASKSANRVNPAPRRGTPAKPAPMTPAPAAATPLAVRRADRDSRVEWLAARPVQPFAQEIAAVREQFHVSESTAKRIRRAARTDGRVSA